MKNLFSLITVCLSIMLFSCCHDNSEPGIDTHDYLNSGGSMTTNISGKVLDPDGAPPIGGVAKDHAGRSVVLSRRSFDES